MKKSYQDSTRLQLNLNEHVVNGEDEGKIFRCTREVRKRESTSLGAKLFAPVHSLSPIFRKHSPNVSPNANDSTTPGTSQKSFIIPSSYRNERTLAPNAHSILQTQLQLNKNKAASQLNFTPSNLAGGYSPISKRLFQADMRSFTPQTAKNDEGIKSRLFFTQRSEPLVSVEEMDRAKKWINQCISEKKKKKSAKEGETSYSTIDNIFSSSKKKGPNIRSYKGKKQKNRLGDLIDGPDSEEPETSQLNYASNSLFESEMTAVKHWNRVESVESFRQLLNDEMVLHKNISYKELSEKWQRVKIFPEALQNINLQSLYGQLDRPEETGDALTTMTNKAVDKYQKKELWLMAIQMERKIASLLENGVFMEETNEELSDRISGLELELTRRKKIDEDRQKQLGHENTSLNRRNQEQRDLIEKLIHEKDGLSSTCKELSEALNVVRSQHEASIKNLKESFEARFTSKLAEVYEKKEKELQLNKDNQEEDMKKMMAKYEESLQKFRKKYNQELQGIQSELNIKTSGQIEVEDRLVHLKSFVHDLITRLKQKEVRCFELESQSLRLRESLNSVVSERASLFRRLEIVRTGYKENLQKLKKEYRRQFLKGVDTLTSGGILNAKKNSDDGDRLDEVSIHGHVSINLREEEDLVMQRINFMMKEAEARGKTEEETRF